MLIFIITMTSIIEDLRQLEELIEESELSMTETGDEGEQVLEELRDIARELSRIELNSKSVEIFYEKY